MGLCRSGKYLLAEASTRIAVTFDLCAALHGHLMGDTSSPEATTVIVRHGCGKQLPVKISIRTGISIECLPWRGRPMVSVSPRPALMPTCKYGMLSVAAISLSIEVILFRYMLRQGRLRVGVLP